MRVNKLLIGATAVALLAGVGAALPQGMQREGGPSMGQAPGGNLPADKGKGSVQREGQGAQPGRAQNDRPGGKTNQTTGQSPKNGQQPMQQGETDRGKAGQRNGNATGQQAPAARGQQQPAQTQRQGDQTQGQAGARITLTEEQRTQLRSSTQGAPRVERANIKFSIAVGTVVPRSIKLVAVPAVIVDTHPDWRGYLYFIVDNELVVVEPRTLKIVAIIVV
jgi:hypothetical protein